MEFPNGEYVLFHPDKNTSYAAYIVSQRNGKYDLKVYFDSETYTTLTGIEKGQIEKLSYQVGA